MYSVSDERIEREILAALDYWGEMNPAWLVQDVYDQLDVRDFHINRERIRLVLDRMLDT